MVLLKSIHIIVVHVKSNRIELPIQKEMQYMNHYIFDSSVKLTIERLVDVYENSNKSVHSML